MIARLPESFAAGAHTQPVCRARAPHICLNQSPNSASGIPVSDIHTHSHSGSTSRPLRSWHSHDKPGPSLLQSQSVSGSLQVNSTTFSVRGQQQRSFRVFSFKLDTNACTRTRNKPTACTCCPRMQCSSAYLFNRIFQ